MSEPSIEAVERYLEQKVAQLGLVEIAQLIERAGLTDNQVKMVLWTQATQDTRAVLEEIRWHYYRNLENAQGIPNPGRNYIPGYLLAPLPKQQRPRRKKAAEASEPVAQSEPAPEPTLPITKKRKKGRDLMKEYMSEEFDFYGEILTRSEIVRRLLAEGRTERQTDYWMMAAEHNKELEEQGKVRHNLPHPYKRKARTRARWVRYVTGKHFWQWLPHVIRRVKLRKVSFL